MRIGDNELSRSLDGIGSALDNIYYFLIIIAVIAIVCNIIYGIFVRKKKDID